MSEFHPPQPSPEKLSEAEYLKAGSNYLRGSIVEALADPLTASVPERETHLLKFHGAYQEDDRDLRNERAAQKLEPAYSFMLRVRATAGIVTPAQWLVLDQLARDCGDGTLRLTTRQAVELHSVLKWKLREAIRRVNESGLTSLATCGDVNRNVMLAANPDLPQIHPPLCALANEVASRLLPRTTAYREIWLDPHSAAERRDEEPLYGATYLPRKFKIAFAVPPSNDVDIRTHDLAFVVVLADRQIAGFNILVGGGLGTTDGEPATYPNLAVEVGFCRLDQVVQVAETVLAIQRDYGDRTNRRHARLKYTVNDRGLDWFQAELRQRLGWDVEPPRPCPLLDRGDRYGGTEAGDGRRHLTLYFENGRIRDDADRPWMTGLRAIAQVHRGDFRLTANQNLIIANVSEADRSQIEGLVAQYRLSDGRDQSPLRRNAMACVALPLCEMAMAEAERAMPQFLTQVEALLAEAGIPDEPIVVRMSGCPNGCARPFVAEIGLVGKAPGHYNLFLGGDFAGQRLNRLYRENIELAEILEILRGMFQRFAQERQPDERFGDFVIRAGYLTTPPG